MLTRKDFDKQRKLNGKNNYSFTRSMLSKLGKKHEEAYYRNDKDTMLLIEYRLTDANFHTESSLLSNHDYQEYKNLLKEIFEY